MDTLLTTMELAARYGVSERVLRTWRYRKMGPKYLKLGKYVRYRMSDVLEWESTRAKDFS